MRRRLLLILSIALLVGAVAVPAKAAIGPVTVVQVGCDFEAVTADAVATSGGLTRGFVSFHGGTCANVGLIFYFQGSGGSWTRAQSPLRGRVLAAADDGSSTFLLYQGGNGIWIAKRPHTGGLVNVQRVSTATQGGGALTAGDLVAFTDQWWAVWTEPVGPGGEFANNLLFQSKTIGAGDCIDPIVKQQITLAGNDERPSIVLKPASAGASGADLFFSRNDGAQGSSGHIRTGSADCTASWAFRRLSFAGDIDLNPDAFRSGPGNNHLTFQRDGDNVVYLNNASGAYRGRQFVTPGVEPRVATSLGVVFVAYKDFRQHPFVAIYRGGAWSGRDLTPGAGDQQVLAVTATGGRGTVLAASQASDRLYAVADL
ncbi:MAG TPA: hypothetical protein VL330_11850 [Actinomycetes bacterium]|nr:hypothetical protein [Actinomycetes bacterium]